MTMEYQLDGAVAEIHFDDGKANAMRTPWFHEITELLDRAAEEGARAIVLRGREGIFSGGLDTKWLPSLDANELGQLIETFGRTMLKIWTTPIPTVAAVTGHAVAGGCILASACDYRVAVDGPYRFQMNEHLISMPLPSWARAICSTAFPVNVVEDLLMLAIPVSPRRAKEIGMVHALESDPGAAAATARKAAAGFTALDNRAFAVSRRRARAAEVERQIALIYDD